MLFQAQNKAQTNTALEPAALTHAVAALFPQVPQTQHALFTAGAVSIGRTTLAQLLQTHSVR